MNAVTRRIALGIIILVIVGACTSTWVASRPRSQQRSEMVLAALRQKIAQTKARATQERVERAKEALSNVWHIVRDESVPAWVRMVDLAKVYRRGMYPFFRPDVDTGNALCRTVILHCPDANVKNEARLLLFSNPVDPDDTLDIHLHAQPLPIEPAGLLTKKAMGSRVARAGVRERSVRSDPFTGPEMLPRPARVVRPDAQNVHDHGVARHVSSILTSLPPAADAASVRQEVEDHIAASCGDHISDDEKAAALHILDSLRADVDNPAIDLSEQEALARVWAQAKHKDFVVQQLASGLEHGQPVCHSGKMARIAAALDDGESDTRRILPMWAVRDHLNSIAAETRTRILSEASPADVEAYNEDNESHLTERMIVQFRKTCAEFFKERNFSPVVTRTIVDEIAEFGF